MLSKFISEETRAIKDPETSCFNSRVTPHRGFERLISEDKSIFKGAELGDRAKVRGRTGEIDPH